MGANVAILADLQGPKLRIGEVENNEVFLKDGNEFRLVTTKCMGDEGKAWMSYDRLPGEVRPGEAILIDDGKIKLEVTWYK